MKESTSRKRERQWINLCRKDTLESRLQLGHKRKKENDMYRRKYREHENCATLGVCSHCKTTSTIMLGVKVTQGHRGSKVSTACNWVSPGCFRWKTTSDDFADQKQSTKHFLHRWDGDKGLVSIQPQKTDAAICQSALKGFKAWATLQL